MFKFNLFGGQSPSRGGNNSNFCGNSNTLCKNGPYVQNPCLKNYPSGVELSLMHGGFGSGGFGSGCGGGLCGGPAGGYGSGCGAAGGFGSGLCGGPAGGFFGNVFGRGPSTGGMGGTGMNGNMFGPNGQQPGQPAIYPFNGYVPELPPQGPTGPMGPMGPTGPQGESLVLEIGNVSTLQPGESATVTQTVQGNVHRLDFGIPQGVQGATGPQGPRGATGATGANGQSPTILVGQVQTLDAGQNATVTTTVDGNNYVLNFGIPQGVPGPAESAGISFVESIYTSDIGNGVFIGYIPEVVAPRNAQNLSTETDAIVVNTPGLYYVVMQGYIDATLSQTDTIDAELTVDGTPVPCAQVSVFQGNHDNFHLASLVNFAQGDRVQVTYSGTVGGGSTSDIMLFFFKIDL